MSKVIKQMEMDALKQQFSGVKNMVFLSATRLTAITENTLRLGLRKKNIRMQMVKNSLCQRVFNELGMKIDGCWSGPTLVVWGGNSLSELSKDIEGREGVNAFSIGIEIVNLNDGKDPYTKAQYDVVDNLIGMLIRRFPTIKYVTSHAYIAQPPGRKSDPVAFDWTKLRRFEGRVKFVH